MKIVTSLQLRLIIQSLNRFELENNCVIYDDVSSEISYDMSIKWYRDYSFRFILYAVLS